MTQLSKFLAFTALICAGVTALAEQPQADTIKCFHNTGSVSVISDGHSSTLNVEIKGINNVAPTHIYSYQTNVSDVSGTDEADSVNSGNLFNFDINQDLPFVRSKTTRHRKFRTVYGRDTYVGVLIPVDNEPGFKAGWEIAIANIVAGCWQPWFNGPSFNLGIGLGYRHLSLKDRFMFSTSGQNCLGIESLPDDMNRSHAHLDMWALQMPLSIRQRIKGDFTIEIGAALTYNFYTRASNNYRTVDNQYRYKESFKHLHQRNFGVDFRFAFGWDDNIGLYVRYSPLSLFRHAFGPKTDMIGVGISLGF